MCKKLKKGVIPTNSELKSIDGCAFSNTMLTSFSFPINLTYIGDFCFANCFKLQLIEIDDNSKMKYFNHYAILFSKKVTVMISSKLNISVNLNK